MMKCFRRQATTLLASLLMSGRLGCCCREQQYVDRKLRPVTATNNEPCSAHRDDEVSAIVACETCLENGCGWSKGKCQSRCTTTKFAGATIAGPDCYSVPAKEEELYPIEAAKGAIIGEMCNEAITKIKEHKMNPAPDIPQRREIFETNETTTTTGTDDDEGIAAACRDIGECLSCLDEPICAWKNGTCYEIMIDDGSGTIPNRTVAADEICSQEDDDEEDIMAIFDEVAAAVENAREQQQNDGNAEEGAEDEPNQNVDVDVEEGTNTTTNSSKEEFLADEETVMVAATDGAPISSAISGRLVSPIITALLVAVVVLSLIC